MSDEATGLLPGQPAEDGELVFRKPWEAHAFAMAVRLHEQGLFTWPQWAAALTSEIEHAKDAGDPDTGETYYHHWLAALERLVAESGAASEDDQERTREAWRRAAHRTPHGHPIVLRDEDFDG
ncbi:MAG: nitrile hydratase accessory protein [Ilumatobacter sp.]|uniref:nitrile hydratase accessory protein n=1 Tax=Ilumatobacter sp. TaxID=1967498 RepID=UPI0026397993|nr:nitrile hydratase accessory protein [Ilumatobacter sp.]MDJ0768046.1 nitrile hydratase accessory protein [Ilumatobacter sp.]